MSDNLLVFKNSVVFSPIKFILLFHFPFLTALYKVHTSYMYYVHDHNVNIVYRSNSVKFVFKTLVVLSIFDE